MRGFSCVPHDVVGKVFFSSKRFATNFTPKWCVIGMTSHVIGQMLFSGIFLAAHCATVRRFSCVPHDVVHKVFLPCKGLFADLAPVRCLPSMFPNVINHMLLPGKILPAKIAPVRGFPRMAPDVILQMLFSGKSFAASSASVRLLRRMPFHVPLQGRSVGEYMKAQSASEHASTQVTFSVPGQFLAVWKGFSTNLAGKWFLLTMIPPMHYELIPKLERL